MNLATMLSHVQHYLNTVPLYSVPGWQEGVFSTVTPLAQGEYNLNYILAQGASRWVLRVNIASQIQREDQILYEYNALRLLQHSGVTPVPYFVDDSRENLDYGLLIMQFLPGRKLDYANDSQDAARLFAKVHSIDVPRLHTLILEDNPLTMTWEECSRLLPVYLDSPLAEPNLRDYLRDVLAWAGEARHKEAWFIEDACRCIINTEVNSGNWLVDRDAGTIYLVDWEKPLYGDPSQDLSHFCAPMTTLWKSDYRMSAGDKQAFIQAYKAAVSDAHLRDTIEERVRLRDPFNYLRGISWSAMAWVSYQTGDHAVKNEDTFRKVCSYLDLDFQRSMFDPYLEGDR